VSGTTNELESIAAALRAALAETDVDALVELLHAEVTWGDCAGRSDVAALIAAGAAGGLGDVQVGIEAAADRLLIDMRESGSPDDQASWRAAFVSNGLIVEIAEAESRTLAEQVHPLGPLDEMSGRDVRVESVAPVLPVADLARAIGHYEALGFEVTSYDGGADYAYANRGDVHLHLVGHHGLDPLVNTSAVYLYVSDADVLYAQWRMAGLDGRLIAPTNTPYGLREGAHVDPDGNLIRFGSALG